VGLVYLGELERRLGHGHHVFIAGRLIASHGVVVGAAFGECSIERVGEPSASRNASVMPWAVIG